MTDNSINSVNKSIAINKSFENHTQVKHLSKPDSKSNGTALLFGSLAALAIGGVIFAATRGKKNVSAVTTNTPVEDIKEVTISAFKNAGNKFSKGKASLASGEKYSGELTENYKDGTKLVLEYTDGILQKSVKSKNNEKLYEKIYTYSDDGSLELVKKDGKDVLEKSVDMFGRLRIDNSKKIVVRKNNIMVITEANGNKKIYIDKLLRYKKNNGYYEYYDKSGKVFVKTGPDLPDYPAFSKGETDNTGLVWSGNNYFLVPESKIIGHFDYHVTLPLNADIDYKPAVRGIDLWRATSNETADLTKNTALLHDTYKASFNTKQDNNYNRFNVEHTYEFTAPDKFKKYINEICGRFGDYKHLDFDFKTGVVSNIEKNIVTPLFKFNPRTKQISDLTIEKEQAMKIIEFGEEQYKIYKKALKSRRNIFDANVIHSKINCRV